MNQCFSFNFQPNRKTKEVRYFIIDCFLKDEKTLCQLRGPKNMKLDFFFLLNITTVSKEMRFATNLSKISKAKNKHTHFDLSFEDSKI